MSRSLVHLNLWLLGGLLVVGLPLVTIGLQATVRRLVPDIARGDHNDVAGFLIAVVGVVYAVTLAFIVIATWEDYSDARATVHREAGDLRSLFRDTRSLPEPTRSEMGALVLRYAEEVADGEWAALDRGEGSRAVFDLVSQMFATMGGVVATTPAHEAFLAASLDRLDDVAESRAERVSMAEDGLLSILWAAIIIGGGVTVGFALLFGVSDQRLHFLMVGAFAAVLGLQIFVVLVLSHPFSGDLAVSPDQFRHVVSDFGG
ncbi:MAG: DUF4239 domain-containing protein [Acidimicrobiales bacterium]